VKKIFTGITKKQCSNLEKLSRGAQSNDLKTAFQGRNYSTQIIQKIVGVSKKNKIVGELCPPTHPLPILALQKSEQIDYLFIAP